MISLIISTPCGSIFDTRVDPQKIWDVEPVQIVESILKVGLLGKHRVISSKKRETAKISFSSQRLAAKHFKQLIRFRESKKIWSCNESESSDMTTLNTFPVKTVVFKHNPKKPRLKHWNCLNNVSGESFRWNQSLWKVHKDLKDLEKLPGFLEFQSGSDLETRGIPVYVRVNTDKCKRHWSTVSSTFSINCKEFDAQSSKFFSSLYHWLRQSIEWKITSFWCFSKSILGNCVNEGFP